MNKLFFHVSSRKFLEEYKKSDVAEKTKLEKSPKVSKDKLAIAELRARESEHTRVSSNNLETVVGEV